MSEKTLVSNGEFFNVDNPPFAIYGADKDDVGYMRTTKEIAEETNDGVAYLYRNTAGVVVRFRTNSKTLAIKAENTVYCGVMPHMNPIGSAGFDAYSGKHFLASFTPIVHPKDFVSEKTLYNCPKDKDGFFDVTINMPLYGAYRDIYVKVDKGAEIREGGKFKNEKPVVVYGSSITQGGCAATPGTGYTNLISRHLNLYVKNLGFSGSCRGEECMAHYIAGLDMSCFIMDYEHNTPTLEYLQNTHKPFFDIIREKNPDLPIIIASAVTVDPDGQGWIDRRNVVRATYEAAKAKGDKNVYFVNGGALYDTLPYGSCTVDGGHQNSMGFFAMAKGFEDILKTLNL